MSCRGCPEVLRSWLGQTSLAAWWSSGSIRFRRSLSELSCGLSLVGRVPLPWLRRRRQLSAGRPRSAAMPGVPAPDLGDGRHRSRPHPAALAALVRRRLLGHHPHTGFLGAAAAAPARARPAGQPGRCCTSCAAPWCDPSVIGSRARWSWTRPTSAGSRKGGAAADYRASQKSILAGAVEVRGHGSGRIRLAVVPDLAATTFARFAAEAITLGSTVLTDGEASTMVWPWHMWIVPWSRWRIRQRLAAVLADLNRPQKHVAPAPIILASAERLDVAAIARRAGISRRAGAGSSALPKPASTGCCKGYSGIGWVGCIRAACVAIKSSRTILPRPP